MGNQKKINLILRYDEDERTLKFYAEADGQEIDSTIRLRSTSHFELDLLDLQSKGADEAERTLGAAVLVFFEFRGGTTLGIRDYAALGNKFMKSFLRDAKHAAAKNEPDSQFELALHHLDKSIKEGLRGDLDLAEKWLETAIANGSGDAKKYKNEYWERMKARAERKIADSAKHKG